MKTTNGITWKAPATIPHVGGRTLTNGVYVPNHPKGGRCIDFGPIMPGGQHLVARLEGKPELEAELARWQKEQQEREAVERAEAEAELNSLKTGNMPIVARWHDGEYLSGHEVMGLAARLLVEIGAAEDISGWGTIVNREVIDKLGTEFTFPQVVELLAPANAAKAERVADAEADRAAKFTEARATGKEVVLAHWTEVRRVREAGEWGDYLFAVTEYACPDGNVKRTAINTY
jgi:hypothetical protein